MSTGAQLPPAGPSQVPGEAGTELQDLPRPAPEAAGQELPDSPQKRLERLGAGITGDFKPEQIQVKGKDNETLQGLYKDLLTRIYTRYKEYAQASGGNITQNQKDFIVLMEKNGQDAGKILQTENGWKMAQPLIEDEMFVQLAALGQNVSLDLKGVFPNGLPEEITIEELEAKGLLNKLTNQQKDTLTNTLVLASTVGSSVFGSAIMLAVTGRLDNPGLERILMAAGPTLGLAVGGLQIAGKEIIKKIPVIKNFIKGEPGKSIKINLSALTIDITNLPEEVKNYIGYCSDRTFERQTRDFVLDAAAGQATFFEELGVDMADLEERFTPWEGFNLGITEVRSVDEAVQRIPAEWVRLRRQFLISGGIGNEADTSEKTRLFHQAQQETVGNFLAQALEIVDKDQVETAMGLIAKRLEGATSQQAVGVRREADNQKLTETNTNISSVREELGRLSAGDGSIPSLTEQLAALDVDMPGINTHIGEIAREIATEKNLIQTQTDKLTPKKGLLGIGGGLKPEEIAAISGTIKAAEERIVNHEQEKKNLETRVRERAQLAARITRLETRKRALEGRLQTLTSEKDRLEKKIAKGYGQSEQKLIEDLRVYARALDRFKEGRVMSELLSVEQSVKNLTEIRSKQAPWGKKSYESGYLRMINLLFDFTNPPAGFKSAEEYFSAIIRVLPPDKIADYFAEPFGYRFASTVTPANKLNNVLAHISGVRRPTQSQFNRAMMSFVGKLEREARLTAGRK